MPVTLSALEKKLGVEKAPRIRGGMIEQRVVKSPRLVNLTLKGTLPGSTPTGNSSFRNEIASNDFLGQVGVDTHLWGPIFARSGVTFNDENVSVMAKLVYQFDICDWFD